MTEQIYLGIDIGAESGRLMAGRWDGRRMVLEELHRFPNPVVAVAGTLRWDLLRLWNDIQHALGLASRRFGGSIVSIGIDTWALDFVLLSESDELLGLPYCYRDPRTIDVRLADGGLRRITGRAFLIAAAGCPHRARRSFDTRR